MESPEIKKVPDNETDRIQVSPERNHEVSYAFLRTESTGLELPENDQHNADKQP